MFRLNFLLNKVLVLSSQKKKIYIYIYIHYNILFYNSLKWSTVIKFLFFFFFYRFEQQLWQKVLDFTPFETLFWMPRW